MSDQCEDSLSAMPGDKIAWNLPDGVTTTGYVETAGWKPTPKGGKVWTYETEDGVSVPSSQVIRVTKTRLSLHKQIESLDEVANTQSFMKSADSLNLPPVIITAIHCLINGDRKHLEVAAFLIDWRTRQLKDLEATKPF